MAGRPPADLSEAAACGYPHWSVTVRSVCLLIALFQVLPDAPLIVAANRDERYDRPAVAMTVLREARPRILGGQDKLAGGTWLAVSEHGVVAGLTNQPSADGRDPTKRSRGELPLAFAARATATEAATAMADELDPDAYNPCWMLVGDRDALFSVGIAAGSRPEVERLPPGLYVLENAPLRSGSAKAARVAQLVAEARSAQPDSGVLSTITALETVLRDHRPTIAESRTDDGGRVWPPEIFAPCVHTPTYGTRSAMTVTVPASGLPEVRVADGPPCLAAMREVTGLWAKASSGEMAG